MLYLEYLLSGRRGQTMYAHTLVTLLVAHGGHADLYNCACCVHV